MSNIRSPISKNSDNYSHAQQNYGNIRVENSSNNDFQFRLNYLEKHFNLLEQRINIVEESQEKSKYSGGADFNTSERIKLLEELILRQKADFNSRIASLEDQLKQAKYARPEKVDETISNSRLVSLEIKFEQVDRTLRLLTEKIAVNGIEGDNLQVLHEIRKLKEAVEDCLHNQRELEIANLDIKRQQREVSFEPLTKSPTPKKSIDNHRGSAAGSNKKEPGSSEKKEHTYSNLKNKYGNVTKTKDFPTESDVNTSSKKDKFYEDIETLKKLVKEEKPRPKSALKSNESSKSPVKSKNKYPTQSFLLTSRSPNKSFSQLTPDNGLSPGHQKKSSANLQTVSFDNRSDLESALEAKRRQIDREIEKRINEQFAERKKIEAAVNHNHKVSDKIHNQEDDFKITPMSTEKSREREVQNRLAREKKLRSEIIDKFANAVPDKRK